MQRRISFLKCSIKSPNVQLRAPWAFTEAFPILAEKMRKNLGGRPRSANPTHPLSAVKGSLNNFSERLNRFNDRLQKSMDEDLGRWEQKAEDERKIPKERLDADPKFKEIYDDVVSKWDND